MSSQDSHVRHSPSLRRRRLGATMRHLREEAIVSRELAGKQLDCSESKISRIENGDVRVNRRDLFALLDLYGIDDATLRTELRELAAQGGSRGGWWVKYNNEVNGSFRRFMELETVATSIRRVSTTAFPGILQTPEYARAVIAATAPESTRQEVERQLLMRCERQRRLVEPNPPDNWVILDEAVLRRRVGSSDVMAGQLRKLRTEAESCHLKVQLIPFENGAHQGMQGSFALLSFLPPDPDVVYTEGFAGEVTVDDADDLRTFGLVFDRLAEQALDPETSLRFIERVIGEYSQIHSGK